MTRPAPELLTPRTLRGLLVTYGLAPRRSAGQNFVVEPNTVRRIVEASGVGPDDTVVEFGPGLGSLTRGLVAVAATVVAIEVDAGFVRVLTDTLGDLDNLRIVHADALDVDLGALLGDGDARLVANLPYNLATPMLLHALTGPVRDAYVMVQREVGERWAARPGAPAYGAVSVKLQAIAAVEVAAAVPRTVFHPVPKVDSVMVRVVRRPRPATTDLERLRRIVDAAFGQRRKTLRNALRGVAAPDAVAAMLEAAGIEGGVRAEALDVDAFVALTRALRHREEGG